MNNIKRLLCLGLSAAFTFGTLSFGASAAEKTHKAGDFTYAVLADGSVEIIKYEGDKEKLTIPSKIDGQTVSTIGESAFYKNESLTNVSIPKTITSIKNYAFSTCTSLKEINIPGSVNTIGKYAFSGCSAVKTLTLGKGIKTIEERAFYKTSSLTSLTIPSTVKSIGEYSFSNLDSITALTIPSNLKSVPLGAFSSCDALTDIKIEKGVQSIGESAFGWCVKLKNVSIPNSISKIDQWAFYDCRSLEEIHFPYTVKQINKQVFGFCSKLKSFDIPSGTKKIDFQAFIGCEKLKSVSVPKSVTEISEKAFYYCTSLKDVNYEGSKADRKKIKISSSNESFTSASIHYNSKIPVYTSAKLSQTKISLKAGQAAKLSVIDESVKKWTSKNNKVAYYDAKLKKVIALKAGTAKISAQLGSGAVLTCKVTVTTSPSLSKYAVTIKKGKKASISISGKSPQVKNIYKVDKKSIASVLSKDTSSTVVIKGLKKGNATVTVTVNGVKLKGIKVTVK